MNKQQYDSLYLAIRKQSKQITQLMEETARLSEYINSLLGKPVVVTDLEEEVNRLHVELKSLKDEKEA